MKTLHKYLNQVMFALLALALVLPQFTPAARAAEAGPGRLVRGATRGPEPGPCAGLGGSLAGENTVCGC